MICKAIQAQDNSETYHPVVTAAGNNSGCCSTPRRLLDMQVDTYIFHIGLNTYTLLHQRARYLTHYCINGLGTSLGTSHYRGMQGLAVTACFSAGVLLLVAEALIATADTTVISQSATGLE
jgi:hypothetical protein